MFPSKERNPKTYTFTGLLAVTASLGRTAIHRILAIAPSHFRVDYYHARQAAFTGGFVILGIWMIISGGEGGGRVSADETSPST